LGLVAKRQWSDLSRTQQRMIIAGAAFEIALADLARRPASQVRGPKPLWAATCFVQPVGPISYLMLGRRTS
jgi:hypothetical protein